jgi:hypothetical protein
MKSWWLRVSSVVVQIKARPTDFVHLAKLYLLIVIQNPNEI